MKVGSQRLKKSKLVIFLLECIFCNVIEDDKTCQELDLAMKYVNYLIIISICLLSGCKPESEDPGPDLSGEISFQWEFLNSLSSYDFYVVISDTTGRVLEWKKLENNIAMPMPYPPGDSKLANVTLIATGLFPTGERLTTLDTYTGIAAGSYVNDISVFVPLPRVTDGEYKITVPNRDLYNIITAYVTQGAVKNYTDMDNTVEFDWGTAIDGSNLLVLLQKHDPRSNRYLYTKNVFNGELTITPEDFDTMMEGDSHELDYPDHASKMDWSFCIINGIEREGSYTVESAQWEQDQLPVVQYPDIPDLFPSYETSVVGIGKNGEYYLTYEKGPSIPTSITTLQADVVRVESMSTRRISVDLSGNAGVITISDGFGPPENSVSWNVLAANTSQLRINLPEFPEDLVEELPMLDSLKDESFNDLSFYDYDISYDDFYKARIKGNNGFSSNKILSKGYVIDTPDNGRRTVDVNAILEKNGIKTPGKYSKK